MAVHDLNPENFGGEPYRCVTTDAGGQFVQTRAGVIIGIKHQRRAPAQSASGDYLQELLLDRRNRPVITDHWILDVMDGPRWPWAFAAAAVVGALFAITH